MTPSPLILITPRSLTEAGLESVPALEPLRAAGFELVSGPPGRLPSINDLSTVPTDIVGWLAGVEAISAPAFKLFPTLKVISRNGAGADAIDADAARAHGVIITTARGANARGVAELAFAHILNGLRGIPKADRALRGGRWERSLGRELADTTVGVVGYGAIGRLVASFLDAFGARVIAYDPFAPIDAESPVRRVELRELLTESDAVTLHSPPRADGTALIGAPELDLLPQGTVLVNTARSSLVDSAAVYAALASGKLAAYAVDAFDTEPPAPSALLEHPNTILTPHLGGYTMASTARATEQAVSNLLGILKAEN